MRVGAARKERKTKMADKFVGSLTGVDPVDQTKERIVLRADSADAVLGGAGRGGDLKMLDSGGVEKIRLDAGGADPLELVSAATVKLHGSGTIQAGGHSTNGKLELRNTTDKIAVSLGGGDTGDLYLRNKTGDFTVALRAVESNYAGLWVGGQGQFGLVTLRNSAGKDTVNLGNGETGDLYLRNKNGDFILALRAVENNYAGMWVGGHGQFGLVTLRNGSGKDTVNLGNGETGDLYLRNKNGEFTVALRAVEGDMAGLWIGGNGQNGHIIVRNAAGTNQIHLDGKAGDIVLANADCAEEFEITEDAPPGTVMTIGDDRRLVPCDQPYDRRVAGIISGAGGTRPGITLGRVADGPKRAPIALVGRVGCRVDARAHPIEIGDLLTTSAERGHAMRAADPQRAFGAVIGKALAPLRGELGLIPVLVALQ
jgi:hypothetical protein